MVTLALLNTYVVPHQAETINEQEITCHEICISSRKIIDNLDLVRAVWKAVHSMLTALVIFLVDT